MGKETSRELPLATKVKLLLYKRLFILEWLPKYTKEDILADIIAGLTVGLTMMPQSIAYAGLAGLPAEYGLYTAFIGSFTYIFVGTIKEVSIGPTSLMSLLTFGYTVGKPIECVILLTFIAGCVELLMGLLKLGFLVEFISPCLTSGFTSASTLIIISAQLKNLLGINIKSHDFSEIMKELFQKYHQLRFADTAMGLVCIGILLILKNLSKMIKTENPSVNKLLWLLSISKNALVVLFATLFTAYWSTYEKPPFQITGNVPKGIPTLQFPSFSGISGNETISFQEMFKSMGSGIIIVPFVGVLSNVAIAKSYSANSIIDASQEMMSLGLANIFGSFVRAMPSSGAFTRSAVASSSDVRTPLQGLYSGAVIILALTFLAPYFYYIPKAVLAAVLITAVSSLFDYAIFPVLWRCNKLDFALTLGTLIIGTFFGVEAAIILGAICNLVALLRVWARPRIESAIKETAETKQMYLYIKPELGLLYPSADYLTEFIKKSSCENPTLPIVLDGSNILRLDYSAAKALENLLDTYYDTETNLVIINILSEVLRVFESVADPELLKLCSISDNIPEISILDILKEEDLPLFRESSERKLSRVSRITINSNRERKLSRTSSKGDRRRSSAMTRNSDKKYSLLDNLEIKKSVYDLE